MTLDGMDMFDVDDTGILELQKDDTSCRYDSDQQAWDDFIDILDSNTLAPQSRSMAATLLKNWRPHIARLARQPVITDQRAKLISMLVKARASIVEADIMHVWGEDVPHDADCHYCADVAAIDALVKEVMA